MASALSFRLPSIRNTRYSPVLSPMNRTIIFFIFICTWSLSTLSWAKSPLTFQVLESESYGESITGVVTTPQGDYLLIQALLTNAGIGDEKGACRILWVPTSSPGMNEVNRNARDWSWSAKSKRLIVSSCTVTDQGTQLLFSGKTDSLTVNLTFKTVKGKLQSLTPPGGKLSFEDDERFHARIVLPWSTVEGQVTKKGKKTQISGFGYVDHVQSTVLMTDLARHWIRFRGLVDQDQSQKTLITIRVDPKQKRSGWIWQEGKSKPRSFKKTELSQIPIKQLKPNGVIPILSDSTQAKLKIKKRIYSYEPVRAYGMLGRIASSWIGDPLVRTYQGELVLNSGQVIKGIIEHAWIRD